MNKTIVLYLLLFIVSILISLPLVLPYFHSGYFPTHDGEWAVVRLTDMYRELRDLQFPARYSGNLNFGYGYPLFNFAYPFPYYLGVVIYSFHIGFVDTIKLLFAISVPLSFFFMFLASKRLWNNTVSGMVSAFLYVFLPYRMVDLYVRGSLGESLAFVLFPAILFSLSFLADKPQTKRAKFFTAVLFAALLMTHNIMALYFGLVILAYCVALYCAKKHVALKESIISLLFGLGMSAFFWLPSLFEKKDILLAKIPIADRSLYFLTPFDLVLPKWGYGVPTASDGFSYQLGIPLVVVFFVLIGELGYVIWKRRFTPVFPTFLFITSVITVLLLVLNLFSATSFLWHLPLFSDINYPWTLLLPISFLLSLCAGFMVKKSLIFAGGGVCLSIIAIVLVFPYAKPSAYVDRGDGFYITNDATTTSSNEYMPLWVTTLPNHRPAEKVVLIQGKGSISQGVNTSKKIAFSVNLTDTGKAQINTIYYPGWKVTVNNTPVNISYANPTGVMQISLPKGSSTVVATFTETPLRLFADTVSIVSLLGIFFYCFMSQKMFIQKKKK